MARIGMATARQTWSGAIAVAGEDGSDWHQGYGFQFWRCRHGFYRADGANGQLTIVMPQYDAVLSVHAGLGDMQKELNLVWQYLVPAMKADPLPADAVAAAALRKRCATLSIKPLGGATKGAEKFCGKTFAFANSRHGFKTVKVTAAGDGWEVELVTAAGTSRFPVGKDAWRTGEVVIDKGPHDVLGSVLGRKPLKVATSGGVGADGVFRIKARFVTGPHDLDLAFGETDGKLVVTGRLRGIGGGKLEGTAQN